MPGDIMMVAAAAGWGTTTLVIQASPLARVPQEKTMLYQLVVSLPMFAIAALAFGEKVTAMPSAPAWGSLGYQTVWVVSVAFVLRFVLISGCSASRLSAFTFLTPIFGVLAGHLVLGEPLTPAFAAAVASMAAGLILLTGHGERTGVDGLTGVWHSLGLDGDEDG